MAMQQQQQGDWAALAAAAGTPAGSPPATSPTPGAQPSGQTPNAKRPRERDVVNPQAVGASQAMTADGFHNLMKLQTRDENTSQIAECAHWNSGLLNAIVTRVNEIETLVKLQDVKVEQLTKDIRAAVDKVNIQDVSRDTTFGSSWIRWRRSWSMGT